jgi:hypothetical protein
MEKSGRSFAFPATYLVTKFYIRASTSYCLLQAGDRSVDYDYGHFFRPSISILPWYDAADGGVGWAGRLRLVSGKGYVE